ncbi:MAG: hypothetical protein IJ174_03115 [Clostridia bacterium]|nr:hypothetical protein [Clostridia bacterium]
MNRCGRYLGLLLAAALLLSGCAAPNEDNQTVNPAVSLSALQYELENMAVDFNALWFFERIEAQTGVHVDFEDVKDSEWESSVSLAFARGNMPDMILRGS